MASHQVVLLSMLAVPCVIIVLLFLLREGDMETYVLMQTHSETHLDRIKYDVEQKACETDNDPPKC